MNVKYPICNGQNDLFCAMDDPVSSWVAIYTNLEAFECKACELFCYYLEMAHETEMPIY
jgi:hypothetical protein